MRFRPQHDRGGAAATTRRGEARGRAGSDALRRLRALLASALTLRLDDRPTLRGSLLAIGLTALPINVLQVLAEESSGSLPARWLVAAAAILVVAGVGPRAWTGRQGLIRHLAALRFGLALLLCVAAATGLGTLVLQTPNEEVFYARYGPLAPTLTWLQLDDLFGSWWFRWLLLLFAVSLLATSVRRRAWQVGQRAFGLVHLGTVLLLAGGAASSLLGYRGVVHLEVGEATDQLVVEGGRTVQLPFELALDGFAVQRRKQQWRLYLVERDGSGEPEVIRSWPVEPGRRRVPGFGRVEVMAVQPSLDDAAPPSVELRLQGGDARLGGDGPTRVELGSPSKILRLAPRGDDVINYASEVGVRRDGEQARSFRIQVNQPARHDGHILYQADYDAETEQHAGLMVVHDPGRLLVLAGFLLAMLGLYHLVITKPKAGEER